MRKVIALFLATICIVTVWIEEAKAMFKPSKFTIVAVGEQGELLSGVRVGVGFEKNKGWGTDSFGQQGVTGPDGKLTFSGQSNGHITYGGRKDGYYDSYYDYDFNDFGTFGWKPWNPELKVVMRKIENPAPMYARDTNIEIPIVGKDVGFDLIAFDWVVPYGKGKHSDFIFCLERRFADRSNFEAKLTMKFSNKHDGVQQYRQKLENGSQFKLPRFAPEVGYESQLLLREWRNPGESKLNRNFNFYAVDLNYLFRVRSRQKDDDRVEAIYGKILGPLSFDPVFSNTAKIYFKYYLNPDYTRNLEFDPKRNLFGTLPDLEQVNEP